MKKAKLLSLALVMVMVFSLFTGCTTTPAPAATTPAAGTTAPAAGTTAAPELKPITWKLSHSRALGSRNDLTVDELIKRVSDATGGKFVIEKYGNNSLGDYGVVQERVSIGDVEMMLASAGMSVNRGLQLAAIPYMFSTWDEALKYINNDGTGLIYNGMEAEFAKIDIKLLGFNPMYFGCVTLTKDIGNLATQPTAKKGLKVRVPSAKMWEALGEAIGFTSTPMAAADAFTAMQTGIVEGMIGGGPEAYWSNYRDVTKFLLPINTHFECHYLTVNMDKFKSLPKEWQDMLVEQGKWIQETATKKAREEENLYFQKFKEIGVPSYEVPDAVIAEYAKLYRSSYWEKLPSELGESAAAVFAKIRSELGV